ncbi:HD domain-containing protein [Psychroserpens sp.]|uniref:HD domain-containing protein n=1 Tax=Psychroserpens sp. TaxID=2020870 RepID=UPI001B213C1C|nr:HD domain-containing protein [Psychroserpens sp.]MBO6605498.1 HD domain-containing protein [Psychroserpens sp.]MBO6653693.1 HD domain-containing protein [Psychroserpens sp.]MBO6682014.1 HD domain-containing protein [Psychroserpens sp.]MBO6748872.1 HD domain-containing protein [Psychroserpens sp.]MBO6915391.1 HD domain-containing protein [Psychroserpens sp.]
MTSIQEFHIASTKTFVQETLANAEGGHDWFHIERVYNNAIQIAKTENVDLYIVALGALLHDIADSKFHNGDESVGPKIAREFLFQLNVDSVDIEHVVNIIENVSFKGGRVERTFSSMELDVIQDADRLDALGAIGIARTFNYGGFKNRKIYDPKIAPNLEMTTEEYKASTAPTINHFYEKLLLLKDRMNTKTGTRMAIRRHEYMEDFLKQFYDEWDGLK